MRLFLAIAAFVPRSDAAHIIGGYADANNAWHRLEVWRDGDRIVRRTDDRLTLYAVRRGAEVDFTVVDPTHAARVSRTQLYQHGLPVDWDELTTLMRRRADTPKRTGYATLAGERCRWFVYSDATRVCWLDALGIPLRIERKGALLFSVESVSSQVDAARLQPPTLPPADDEE